MLNRTSSFLDSISLKQPSAEQIEEVKRTLKIVDPAFFDRVAETVAGRATADDEYLGEDLMNFYEICKQCSFSFDQSKYLIGAAFTSIVRDLLDDRAH